MDACPLGSAMVNLKTTKPIHRFGKDGKIDRVEDEIVQEYKLGIHLDGKDFVQAVLSPTLLEEFVTGFLLTRRLIRRKCDIASLEINDNMAFVRRIAKARKEPVSLQLLETTGSRNLDLESIFDGLLDHRLIGLVGYLKGVFILSLKLSAFFSYQRMAQHLVQMHHLPLEPVRFPTVFPHGAPPPRLSIASCGKGCQAHL